MNKISTNKLKTALKNNEANVMCKPYQISLVMTSQKVLAMRRQNPMANALMLSLAPCFDILGEN